MAQVGKPGGGVSGKPGMGGGGGGGPMTAEQADAANQTRRQNMFTTVGGLSRPGAAATPPPTPRPRPSGPSGPPAAATPPSPRQRSTLPSNILDPLIQGGQVLTNQPGGINAAPRLPPIVGGFSQNQLDQSTLTFNPRTGKMEKREANDPLFGIGI